MTNAELEAKIVRLEHRQDSMMRDIIQALAGHSESIGIIVDILTKAVEDNETPEVGHDDDPIPT